MSRLADVISRYLDLETAPFTLPRSRLLVRKGDGGIDLSSAEYERRLADCVIAADLRIFDAGGTELAVTRVLPDRIEFAGGRITMTFDGPGAISIGSATDAAWSLTVNASADVGRGIDARWQPGLPSAARAVLSTTNGLLAASGRAVTARLTGPGASVHLAVGDDPQPSGLSHEARVAETASVWDAWFDRCPIVRDDLQVMTAFCWWVLGANIVELPGQAGARAVVPSKIGYVGLWQWDAYFIAVGLRHGDAELAREQLALAFRFPSADGQLPDVVHDEGVLMSSDDLPPGDRENLRRHGSKAADPGIPVPLTKPPLAAWALRKVVELTGVDDAWLRRSVDTIARSQEWWFSHADSDGDGMPEYGHPYSSGLDDSPVFDHDLPLASPDLAAYLVVQDTELARFRREFGEDEAAARHEERAAATLHRLLRMWDDERGHFRAVAAGSAIDEYTVVSLLPLLTGRLPAPILKRIRLALVDVSQFATPFPIPTVAVSDPSFSPKRMWRGPVWVNINALLVEGLFASGCEEDALALAESTVRMVIHGGGPHEYFNPFTGKKAATATTSFGWSAALFIDLAVRLSA